MLAVADAALLIGDPALLALEDKDARAARTGEQLLYLDLAHEWHGFTGLPWVSAFWALRPDALEETGACATELVEDLQSSRDHGLAHRGRSGGGVVGTHRGSARDHPFLSEQQYSLHIG